MKKLLFTLMPLALVLSSCNGASTIDEAKAKEIAKAVETESLKVKGVELTTTSKTTTKNGDSTATVENESFIRFNANGEGYYKNVSETEGTTELYHVFDETYEEVYCYYTTKGEEKTYEVNVKKDNELAFGIAQIAYSLTEILYKMPYSVYSMPYSTFFAADDATDAEEDEEDENYDTVVTYSSSGEKNLTIDAKRTLKEDASENPTGAEAAKEMHITAKYDDLHLVEVVIDQVSTLGNTSYSKTTVTIKDDVTITLPEGWEDHIQKQ